MITSLRYILGLTAAVCLIFSGNSTQANDPPVGSRLGTRLVKVEKTDRIRAVRKAQRLAECFVNRRAEMTLRFLRAGSAEQSGKLREILFNSTICADCTESELVEESVVIIPDDLVRGYLAEAYLNKNKMRAELQFVPGPAAYARPWFAGTTRDPAVDEMSVCAVETNPGAVNVILDTGALSPEEGKAFAGIVETLGKCLRVGAKLTGNRETLRAGLADALFQKLYPSGLKTTETAE